MSTQQLQERAQQSAHVAKTAAFKLTKVAAALREGKLPTQQQIESILETIHDSDILNSGAVGRTGRFSAEGSLVVEDVKNVIACLIKLGNEKNGDNKFQKFLYHTSQASADVDLPNVSAADISRKDAKQAAESIRTLGNLLVTSADFRGIINEGVLLIRDLFADAATQVADKAKDLAETARPSEDERKGNAQIEKGKKKANELQKRYRTGRLQADVNEEVNEAKVSVREWIDEKLPSDPKDETIERLKKFITNVQSKPEYHSSVNTLVDLVKKYANKGIETAKDVEVETDDDASQAMQLLREIVETLANGKNLDDLYKTFDKVVQDVKNDERLTAFADDVGKYVDRLLHDEGYVASSKAYRKADQFVDRAQELAESNAAWKEDSRKLVDELRDLQTQILDDKTTSQLIKSLGYLQRDLADFSAAGFNLLSAKSRGLYADLWDVVLPRVIAAVKQIPLPRIEYVSEQLDIAIDDFVLESASFVPDRIQILNRNNMTMEQGYAAFATNFDASMVLKVSGLRVKASNVAYYVNAKTGWGYEDSGLLAIDLSHDGLSFEVALETADEDDRESFFKVKNVSVDIDSLDYSVSSSDHYLVNSVLKPFVKPTIQTALTKALESQIRSFLEDADLRLFALQQRAVAASNAAPTVSDWFRAIIGNASSPNASAKTTQKGVVITGPHGEFKLAIGADEMLLPGRGGPSKEYEKRKALIAKAKKANSKVAGASASTTIGRAQAALGEARDEAEVVSTELKRQRRKEAAQTGWQSKAFDL